MAKGRGPGADGDIGMEEFVVARADRLEEILHVGLGGPLLALDGLLVHGLFVFLGLSRAGAWAASPLMRLPAELL